jgi:hypothetical protein
VVGGVAGAVIGAVLGAGAMTFGLLVEDLKRSRRHGQEQSDGDGE